MSTEYAEILLTIDEDIDAIEIEYTVLMQKTNVVIANKAALALDPRGENFQLTLDLLKVTSEYDDAFGAYTTLVLKYRSDLHTALVEYQELAPLIAPDILIRPQILDPKYDSLVRPTVYN